MENQRCYRRLVELALAAVVVVTLGCSRRESANRAPVKTKAEAVQVTPVKTIAVTSAEVQQTTLQPATVTAFFRAEIRARVSGFVKEIKADIGDFVEAGADLVVIDVPEMLVRRQVIEARVRRLEAEEQRSQAGIELARARLQSSKAKLAEAKSQMSRVEASLAASEAEFRRTEDLVQRGSLQNRMLDEVRKKRDSELAGKEAMASTIDSAAAEVTVAEAQLTSAEADLQAARAESDVTRRELDEIDVLMNYTILKAPIAGIVTDRRVEPGDLVREASEVGKGQPLLVVSQVDKVRVRIPVPETDAGWVQLGDEVSLNFPFFSSVDSIEGTVTRRSGNLDPSTRTMIVEVDLPNEDGRLLPGMFGQATIRRTVKVDSHVLPAQAIRFDEVGQAYVYVVDADETVTIASITTGMDDGNTIEVLAGIEPGQRVIGPHLRRFTDGQKVAILP